MAEQKVTVNVEQDHLKNIATIGKPSTAIAELIWNALDADADKVIVQFNRGELHNIESIIVLDNGVGISKTSWEQAFGNLGGSPKLEERFTESGRSVHGHKGEGRYRAFGLGSFASWESVYLDENEERRGFKISGNDKDLKTFEISSIELPQEIEYTGVRVAITNIDMKMESAINERETLIADLASEFSWYLMLHGNIELNIDGCCLNPNDYVNDCIAVEVLVHHNGEEIISKMRIVEWKPKLKSKFRIRKNINFYDSNGLFKGESQSRIHTKGFRFTAYVNTPILDDEKDLFAFEHMHPELIELKKQVTKSIRRHYNKWKEKRDSFVVERWVDEGVYPYDSKAKANNIELRERDLFNLCASYLDRETPGFKKATTETRRLTFSLLRKTLVNNSSSLLDIFRSVIELSPDEVENFGRLLAKTDLTSIISTSSDVLDRLEALNGLNELMKGSKYSDLEPIGLLNAIKHELWIFGEQFCFGMEDKPINKFLIDFIKENKLGYRLGEELKQEEESGSVQVHDLIINERFRNVGSKDECLVVGVSRTKNTICRQDILQFINLAVTVSTENSIDALSIKWTFILVGDSIGSDAVKMFDCDTPGRINKVLGTEILCFTWDEIINAGRDRMRYLDDKLNIEVNSESALKYLNEKHHRLFRKPQTSKQESRQI